MAIPTIPIDARVGVSVNFKEIPAKVSLKDGQVKTYGKKKFRSVSIPGNSYSVFVFNADVIDAFLLERKGYKAFILPQTNKAYICIEYSIKYKDDLTKGTVTMSLIPYTNNIAVSTGDGDVVDLSNYYTKSETTTTLNNALATYYNKANVDSLLSSKADSSSLIFFYTKTQTDTLFSNYYTKSQIDSSLAGYYTKTQTDSTFGNYYTKTQADAGFYSKTQIDTTLTGYYTKSQIDTTFGNYYTKTQNDALFNLYYTKTQIDTTFTGYYTKSQIDTTLTGYYNKTQVDTTFSSYYTKTQADALLNAKTALTVYLQDMNTKVNKSDSVGKDLHYSEMLWTTLTSWSSSWSNFSTDSDNWDIAKYTLTNQGDLIIVGLVKKSSNGNGGELIFTDALPLSCRPVKNKFSVQFQWTGTVGKVSTTLLNNAGQITYGGATGDAISYLTLNTIIPIDRKVVGLIGDSITAGAGATTTANRYATLYATAIGLIEDNVGISGVLLQNTGSTSGNMQDRFIADILRHYPKQIVICGGLNDLRSSDTNVTLAKYQAALTFMVTEALKYYAGEQITICSPPMMNPAFFTSYTGFTAGTTLKQQQYRDAVKAVALTYKVKYVDFYQAMVDNGGIENICSDGVHPGDGTNSTRNGHLLLKNTLLNTAAIPYV